jgi:hypothetical protein
MDWKSAQKYPRTPTPSGHTFLTKAREYTQPFTLQYVAGHDNIKKGEA